MLLKNICQIEKLELKADWSNLVGLFYKKGCGWNPQIAIPVWKAPIKTMFQWLMQKKFQNKQKNSDKVYQLNSFGCIINLTYRTPLSYGLFRKLIIQQRCSIRYFYSVCPAKLDHTCRCKSGHGNRQ